MHVICKCLVLLFVYLVLGVGVISAPPIEKSLLLGKNDFSWHDFWIFRLAINILGYSTVVLPAYLLISYIKRSNYVDQSKCNIKLLDAYLLDFSIGLLCSLELS